MFLNYIRIALRNLLKHKMYSLINIGGLAIGLTAVILIGLYVRYETSYDKFWDNGDKVYRAEVTFNVPGRAPMEIARTPGLLIPTLVREHAGSIKYSSRIMRNCYEIKQEAFAFTECADFVDPEFLELFNFDVVAGNAEAALQDNSSIMIAESIALKYFGNQDVLGQTLTMDNVPYTVVAIMKNLPTNSHINSDMIGKFDPIRFTRNDGLLRWTETSAYSYFMLNDGVTIDQLAADMPEMLEKNVTFQLPGLENMSPSELMEISFTKVSDIHLESRKDGNMTPAGDKMQVYTFSGVALMVLLIATINFMNLSSARATQRAREVSMRKVMGATRGQLIVQFLGEAIIMTLFGLLAAIAFVELLLPLYNQMLGAQLTFDLLTDLPLLGSMIGLMLLIGVMGGLYPAFVLSSFRPALVLHSSNAAASGSSLFRNILVLAQFSITIGLMIVTGVIYGQTVYATNTDLGFETEDRLVIRDFSIQRVHEKYQTFRQELGNIEGVEAVTFGSDSMPLNNGNNTLIEAPGGQLGGNILAERVTVDYDYFSHYGVEVIAGRDFSREFAADEFIAPDDVDGAEEGNMGPVVAFNAIINEKALAALGFDSPEAALNQQIKVMVGDGPKAPATIIGVIPDVKFRSARQDMNPMLFTVQPHNFFVVHVKVSSGDNQAMLTKIANKWNDITDSNQARVSFVETNLDNLYQGERLQAAMFLFFALFAIFVACLGLFGMANFTAERRTKEIGIRKVMGAGVFDIVRLLVLQASKPVLWANVIAWPLAGYWAYTWLQGFTVRMELGYLAMLFALAALLAVLIAWTTVSFHAFKVAKANPIKALRTE